MTKGSDQTVTLDDALGARTTYHARVSETLHEQY